MGRKPIKADLLMKQFTHWLDPNEIARLHAFAGKQKVSEYLRAAISEKLDRDGGPAFDPVTMPLKQPAPSKPKRPTRRPPSL